MNIDEEYMKETSHKRRIRQQAVAILRRGKQAGIPERFLRTTKDTFKGMLCDKYNDVDKIADIVFDNSNKLTKIPNIVIDGGNSMVRHQIGCTILFRIIACDKIGTYTRCDRLSHKLEDMRSDGTMSRNEYVEELQRYDALFIGEVKRASFNEHLSAGSFMDELLGYRFDNMLPTVFSFTKALCDSNEISPYAAGELISAISVKEFASNDSVTNPTTNYLRVRVKNI
jgi:hypothetical protein